MRAIARTPNECQARRHSAGPAAVKLTSTHCLSQVQRTPTACCSRQTMRQSGRRGAYMQTPSFTWRCWSWCVSGLLVLLSYPTKQDVRLQSGFVHLTCVPNARLHLAVQEPYACCNGTQEACPCVHTCPLSLLFQRTLADLVPPEAAAISVDMIWFS